MTTSLHFLATRITDDPPSPLPSPSQLPELPPELAAIAAEVLRLHAERRIDGTRRRSVEQIRKLPQFLDAQDLPRFTAADITTIIDLAAGAHALPAARPSAPHTPQAALPRAIPQEF